MENDIVLPAVRPPGPLKVWFTVRGTMKSEVPREVEISIQEIPKDRYEDIVEHMSTYFVADEAMCSSLGVKDDPQQLDDLQRLWRICLKQELSVGAFVDDPNGGKPIIVGANVLCVDFKGEEADLKKFTFKSTKTKNMLECVLKIHKEIDMYDMYNVDRYMYAMGLSVHPLLRGQGLAVRILQARENIGREYKIPVTSTAFTSIVSQKTALRAGFNELLQRDYNQIFDKENQLVFPNIKEKTLKVMARRLY